MAKNWIYGNEEIKDLVDAELEELIFPEELKDEDLEILELLNAAGY